MTRLMINLYTFNIFTSVVWLNNCVVSPQFVNKHQRTKPALRNDYFNVSFCSPICIHNPSCVLFEACQYKRRARKTLNFFSQKGNQGNPRCNVQQTRLKCTRLSALHFSVHHMPTFSGTPLGDRGNVGGVFSQTLFGDCVDFKYDF